MVCIQHRENACFTKVCQYCNNTSILSKPSDTCLLPKGERDKCTHRTYREHIKKKYPEGDLCTEGCGHEWVLYGYCGHCYCKKIQEVHEAAANSTLTFKGVASNNQPSNDIRTS